MAKTRSRFVCQVCGHDSPRWPEANGARLAASARRLALPELSIADFMGSIVALVSTDSEWVPSEPDTSLYLRPFVYASEKFIGVRPSTEVEYLVIASPAGPYFSCGVQPEIGRASCRERVEVGAAGGAVKETKAKNG